MDPNHSVILLTGAWHQAIHYDKLIEFLRDDGFRVICHTHPSMTAGKKDVPDDIVQARWLAEREIGKGRTVDIITHSYGGTVAGKAFQGLGLKTRQAEGKAGGVRKLIGLATSWFSDGDRPMEVFQQANSVMNITMREDGTIFPGDPIEMFYLDLSKEDQDFAINHLVPASMGPPAVNYDNPCWLEFGDVYFLKTLQDRTLKPAFQDLIIKRFQETTGKTIKVTDADCSHSPMAFDENIVWVKNALRE